jgi:hypothetical protein
VLSGRLPALSKQWGAWQPLAWKADGGTHAPHVAPDVYCFQRLSRHPNSIERAEEPSEGWQTFALVGENPPGGSWTGGPG